MSVAVAKSGPEFTVNTQTADSQSQPRIVGLTVGGYVVTWQDGSGTLGDTSGTSIKAQVFDANDNQVGSELLVNTSIASDQANPAITRLTNGGFVISWEDSSLTLGDASGISIKGQMFDGGGNKVGSEFLVNTNTAADQKASAVAGLGGGGFVVTWTDASGASGDASGTSVKAQVFDAGGNKVGTEFLVNTNTASDQDQQHVSGLSSGGIIVTWRDASGTLGDSSGTSTKGQLFDAAGNKVGAEFLLNSLTAGDQGVPLVTGLDGGFVVAWSGPGEPQVNTAPDVNAQVFDAAGNKVGAELLLTPNTMRGQSVTTITSLSDGGFVVGYMGGSASGHVDGGQAFDDFGNKLAAFGVGGLLDLTLHGVGGLTDGTFVVVGTRGSFSPPDIKAQHYKFEQLPVVANPISDQFSPEETAWSFQFPANTFFDAEGDPLTYTASGMPSWISFNAATRTFSGTPPLNLNAAIPLTVRASDGLGDISDTFILTISDTITFNFRLVDATVSYVGNTVIIDGPSSHTVLTGFETFVFTDGTVNNNDGDWLVDDLFYYARNHDVWNAHVDADAHYHSFGWHEGRNPDAFFSTVVYLSANPDVQAAAIDPLIHFDQNGWHEGRVPSLNFDPGQYLDANPDVAAANLNPLAHFLQHGAGEGRQPFAPSELIAANGFDFVYYLQTNPDVAAANVDPFVHFQNNGWHEGRNPNALFDTAGYLATYGDVAAANVNPLDHYHQYGWTEGRDPSTGFDTTDYRAAYADVAAAHVNPLAHFLAFGIHEGRSPFGDGVWG